MLLHRRGLHSEPEGRLRGRLDLRAPEDVLAADDQVEERYRRPIVAPKVDDAMRTLLQAWRVGDDTDARAAAAELVGRTRAYFQERGVPVFAHPTLPPQFADLVADSNDLGRIASFFPPDARPAVAQELMALVSPIPQPKPDIERPVGARRTQIESAPTFLPREEDDFWDPYLRWAQTPYDWITGRNRPRHSSPPGRPRNAGQTWDQEFEQRVRQGDRMQASGEFPEYRGMPRGPHARDLVRRQSDPYAPIAPKEPYPEDPYKDRTAWPVRPDASTGQVVVVKSPYGPRVIDGVPEHHNGIDFRNPLGGPVFSPRNGTILRVEPNGRSGGNQVYVLFDDGTIVGFSHTKWMEGLQEGDEVYAGQQIGISDGSGTKHPHTHMSVYPPGTPIDTILPPPRLRGQGPSEAYTDARKPPPDPTARDINAPVRLQIDPFARGGMYGDRIHNRDYRIDRS